MANYSGVDTQFQIGLEVTYGTAATASEMLEILNESLHQVNTPVESEALVGAVTTPYYSVIGKKVEGDASIEVHPGDALGILLGATLGTEVDAAVDGDAYKHVFTPIYGGDSLPSVTAIVDKKADVFTYTGLKIDSLTLECDPGSLLTSTVSFIGQQELLSGSLATLTPSALTPYDFNDMKIYFGTAGSVATTNISQATTFSFTYANNLENDLYVADGNDYMAEIDYQKRDITFDIETLYDTATNAYREANYKDGSKLSVQVEFTHKSNAATGKPYKIVIDFPNAVITEAPNDISGGERLRIPMSFRALQVGSVMPVTITITDAFDGEYLG